MWDAEFAATSIKDALSHRQCIFAVVDSLLRISQLTAFVMAYMSHEYLIYFDLPSKNQWWSPYCANTIDNTHACFDATRPIVYMTHPLHSTFLVHYIDESKKLEFPISRELVNQLTDAIRYNRRGDHRSIYYDDTRGVLYVAICSSGMEMDESAAFYRFSFWSVHVESGHERMREMKSARHGRVILFPPHAHLLLYDYEDRRTHFETFLLETVGSSAASAISSLELDSWCDFHFQEGRPGLLITGRRNERTLHFIVDAKLVPTELTDRECNRGNFNNRPFFRPCVSDAEYHLNFPLILHRGWLYFLQRTFLRKSMCCGKNITT